MPLTFYVRLSSRPDPADPKITFDGTQRIVIGRGSGCDVRLPDPSVSHRHATVEAKGAQFVIYDEGSTNGTFVGTEALTPRTDHPLRSGEHVRLGKVTVEVRVEQTPVTRELSIATKDLALALVARAMSDMGDDTTSRVRVVDGPDMGTELRLEEEGRVYVVGRGASADFALNEGKASREHLQIVRRGSVVLVRDLGSKHGSFLGDSRIEDGRDVGWRPGALLCIGTTRMELEEPVATALAELEDAPDEAYDPPQTTQTTEVIDAPRPSKAVGPLKRALPSPRRRRARPTQGQWSPTDIAVMLAALSLFGVSLAGLFWLLRG